MNDSDAAILKVHVQRDGVWCLTNEALPRRVARNELDFLESKELSDATHVRLVGAVSNAALITRLYNRRVTGELQSVQVCSPLVYQTERERQDPATLLRAMRNFVLAPSCGGFHELTPADLDMYSLAAAVYAYGGEVNRVRPYLYNHPAWPAISFVRTLDESFCAAMLATIVDPRWYIDPCNPDRTARLEARMGLNPKTQAGVSIAGRKPWRRHPECMYVLRSWQQPQMIAHAVEVFEAHGSQPVADSTMIGLHPGDFPWRVWGHLRGYGSTGRIVPVDPVIADLRASQCFLRFVRQTWLAALYSDSVLPDQGRPLMKGSDFFRLYDVEAAAFDHHMLCVANNPTRPS